MSELVVLRDGERVGTLTRTSTGSVFQYDDAFFLAHRARPGGIAATLPFTQQAFVQRGGLPPCFAGLLPEGETIDDPFERLAQSGGDTAGDVFVEAPTPAKRERRPLDDVRFRALPPAFLAGVQKKVAPVGVTFGINGARQRDAYLVKLAPADAPTLVANEAFFLEAARACRLQTVRSWVVRDAGGEPGLLVKRFDRQWSRERRRHLRLHQEDLCQLLGRLPSDKHRLGCTEIFEALEVCAAPIPARLRLLELVAFSYLIGNGQLHGKNVSVLQTDAGLALAPAYDLLSTLPYGDRQLALEFNGRTDDLSANDFFEVGGRFGVAPAAVRSMLDRLVTKLAPFEARLGEIGLDARQTKDLARTMAKRRADLA